MDEPQRYAKWKKPNSEDKKWYDCKRMKCVDRANQRSFGSGSGDWLADGLKGILESDGNVLKLDCSDDCTLL